MISLDGLCRRVRGAFGRHLELCHKVAHRLGKCRLIALHRQQVTGTAISDGLSVLACVRIASIVTIKPSRASVARRSGTAVFSFDFAAVARCPSTSPAPATKALTRCSGVALTLPERRLVLPSIANGIGPDGRKNSAYPAPERLFKLVGVNQTKRAPKGVVRRNAIFQIQVTTQPVETFLRPQLNFDATSTALTAITINSTRSCSTFAACLGSLIDTNTSAKRSSLPISMACPKKTEN